MPLALQFDQTGAPAAVLALRTVPSLPCGERDVRVALQHAAVHPADLNFISGTYGRQAELPAIPGHEASGRVLEVGAAVTHLRAGDQVIALQPGRLWASEIVAPATHFWPVPTGIESTQACLMRINPLTAWCLLEHYADLTPGAYVAQNAANSAVGRCVIQLLRERGLRGIHFVRRNELINELTGITCDVVLMDDEAGHQHAREQLGDAPLLTAFNAVGGESAGRLMDLLSTGGQLITYGAMSQRSLKVPNKHLIFKDLTLRGFWLTPWVAKQSPGFVPERMAEIATLIQQGKLEQPIAAIFPMAEHRAAVTLAAEGKRAGKVLISLQ